ncbi:MAG: hypothetical protein K0U59_06620 [Gammaproteobacteria bacterium]|nr:hypothetical protein [Gammaproteobacteria bacterium]
MLKVFNVRTGAPMKVLIPQLSQGGDIIGCNFIDPGGAIDQPSDGSGITQIGGQLGVGMVQKVPLACQTTDFRGQRRLINQIDIPNLPVSMRLNLENTQPVPTALLEMKTEL